MNKDKKISFKLKPLFQNQKEITGKYKNIMKELIGLGGEDNQDYISFSESLGEIIMFLKEDPDSKIYSLSIHQSSTLYAEAKEFIEIIKEEAEQQEEEMNGQTIN
jgi:ABC-type molybdate transport system substrate-binding protein